MKVNVELNREELATVQEALLILSAIAAAKDETATQYDAKRMEVKLAAAALEAEHRGYNPEKQCFNGGDPSECSCPDCGPCLVDVGAG